MKTRSVVIHRLSIRSDPADGPVKNVTLTAYVSKGTYIRSLAGDIARASGRVGHLPLLRRTRLGPLPLDQAFPRDNLGEGVKVNGRAAVRGRGGAYRLILVVAGTLK